MNAVCVFTICSLAEEINRTRPTPERAAVSVSGRDRSPSVISTVGNAANARALARLLTSALTGRLFRTNSRITADPATPLPAATSTVSFVMACSLLPHVPARFVAENICDRLHERDGTAPNAALLAFGVHQGEPDDVSYYRRTGENDVAGCSNKHHAQPASLAPVRKRQQPCQRRERQDRVHGYGVGRLQASSGRVRRLRISSEYNHHALGDHQRPYHDGGDQSHEPDLDRDPQTDGDCRVGPKRGERQHKRDDGEDEAAAGQHARDRRVKRRVHVEVRRYATLAA